MPTARLLYLLRSTKHSRKIATRTMMKLTCILFALAVVGTYADEPEKIVNGKPTSVEEYPHVVSMQAYGSHMCGGSIIASRTILTAGHCVQPLIADSRLRANVKICTGRTYLNQPSKCFNIEELFLHPEYNGNMGRPAGADIGIIRLRESIPFNARQRAIRLPMKDLNQGEGVTTVAWGSRGLKMPIHNDLQKLDAKSMSPSTCQQHHLRTGMRVDNKEFCTLITQGTGTCHGDSGSGVVRVADSTIIGLVSGGYPCAKGFPDIFTNVYQHLVWILPKIK